MNPLITGATSNCATGASSPAARSRSPAPTSRRACGIVLHQPADHVARHLRQHDPADRHAHDEFRGRRHRLQGNRLRSRRGSCNTSQHGDRRQGRQHRQQGARTCCRAPFGTVIPEGDLRVVALAAANPNSKRPSAGARVGIFSDFIERDELFWCQRRHEFPPAGLITFLWCDLHRFPFFAGTSDLTLTFRQCLCSIFELDGSGGLQRVGVSHLFFQLEQASVTVNFP